MNAQLQSTFEGIFLHTPDCHRKSVIENRKREFARRMLEDHVEDLLPELKEHPVFIAFEREIRHAKPLMSESQYADIGRKLMIMLQDTAEAIAEEMGESK